MHTLPLLPYEKDALEPLISAETIDYHYGKHHKTYVDKLNALLEDSPLKDRSLEEVIKSSDGAIFNNAAQVWNHTFYWHCLTPNKNTKPVDSLLEKINTTFGSLEALKTTFCNQALNNFGSGWTWLVINKDHDLEIVNTSNAATPISESTLTPILTCDVWEHAYYIDSRNNRAQYLENFWTLINWTFVSEQYTKSCP